jgi:hypothetical protein
MRSAKAALFGHRRCAAAQEQTALKSETANFSRLTGNAIEQFCNAEKDTARREHIR